MDDSVWFGIGLALVMIFLMFLPNYLFKPPANYEEIRDQYIRDMISLSEEELKKEASQKKEKKSKNIHNSNKKSD